MNSKLLMALGASIILISSCTKNDEMTVTLKTSGTLKVNVKDDAGNPFKNTNVRLTYRTSEYYSVLDQKKTDDNGNINFGELIEGNYYIVVDTPKIDGIKYMPYQTFQIISGSEKQIDINVAEFVGKFTLTVQQYDYNYIYTPFADQNVILVPYETYYYNNNNIESLIQAAEYRGITNSAGSVSFTIPSDREFVVLIYNDNTYYNLGSIYVSKGSNGRFSTSIYVNNYKSMTGIKDPMTLIE